MVAVVIHTLLNTPANPSPWNTRATIICSIELANPAAVEAMIKRVSETVITGRVPCMSASLPTIGTATADANENPANIHVNNSNPPISATMFCEAVATTVWLDDVTITVTDKAMTNPSLRRYAISTSERG
jgi:hypothetical protein